MVKATLASGGRCRSKIRSRPSPRATSPASASVMRCPDRHVAQRTVQPPSTARTWPVTSEAAGDAQEQHRARHLDRPADPVQRRDPLDGVGAEAFVRQRRLRARRGDEGRRDRVHRDPEFAPLDREAARHVRDRRLGQAVDRLPGQRDGARLRAHVDDPPASPGRDHRPGRMLRQEEGRFHVEVEDVVEVGLADVERHPVDAAAGVVDQDVEPPELRHRAVDRPARLLEVEHVHLQRQRPPPQRGDLVGEPAVLLRSRRPERHVGPGPGQRQRDRAPEPARGPGHQRHLPGQIEARQFRHRALLRGPAPL